MKTTVYNFKGGVGKTVLSLNLALTMEYSIVTNDIYSPIEKVLDENRILKIHHDEILPSFPDHYNIIFDLGGHIDKLAISAIKQSDFVLVPVIKGFINIQVTIDTITELLELNQNVIIVANQTKPGDMDNIRVAIERFFDLPVFEIKQSKSLPNIFKEKKSVRAMVSEGGLKKYHFNAVADQFDLIIGCMKERGS
jgi:cellulose biosynthesis protein BcsQ